MPSSPSSLADRSTPPLPELLLFRIVGVERLEEGGYRCRVVLCSHEKCSCCGSDGFSHCLCLATTFGGTQHETMGNAHSVDVPWSAGAVTPTPHADVAVDELDVSQGKCHAKRLSDQRHILAQRAGDRGSLLCVARERRSAAKPRPARPASSRAF